VEGQDRPGLAVVAHLEIGDLSVVTARPRDTDDRADRHHRHARSKTGPASCAHWQRERPPPDTGRQLPGIFAFAFTCFPLPLFSVDRRGGF
jgi:hypothetical protein